MRIVATLPNPEPRPRVRPPGLLSEPAEYRLTASDALIADVCRGGIRHKTPRLNPAVETSDAWDRVICGQSLIALCSANNVHVVGPRASEDELVVRTLHL